MREFEFVLPFKWITRIKYGRFPSRESQDETFALRFDLTCVRVQIIAENWTLFLSRADRHSLPHLNNVLKRLFERMRFVGAHAYRFFAEYEQSRPSMWDSFDHFQQQKMTAPLQQSTITATWLCNPILELNFHTPANEEAQAKWKNYLNHSAKHKHKHLDPKVEAAKKHFLLDKRNSHRHKTHSQLVFIDTSEVDSLLSLGVPLKLKPFLWCLWSGALFKLLLWREHYHELMEYYENEQSPALTQIRKDLHRTSQHEYYKTEAGITGNAHSACYYPLTLLATTRSLCQRWSAC